MANCFTNKHHKKIIPISLLLASDFASWLALQDTTLKNWLKALNIKGKAGELCLVPKADGTLAQVIYIIADKKNFWEVGNLPFVLPPVEYQFDVKNKHYRDLALAWGLGAYQFNRYCDVQKKPAILYLPPDLAVGELNALIDSIYLVRDLINTPTEDMGPSEFAKHAAEILQRYNIKLKQIIGTDLLKENYPGIHIVGRASDDAPRLIEFVWGNAKHPKVTLVGKGVCFDSGGLDLKTAPYMLLMKKDMGGAAHVLGLANLIMQTKLPIRLRVLIPLLENVISGNAYRPGDVIKSRNGKTIEIGNTDAEGRVILADALSAAVEDDPELIIDISTLTGAARVAVGTEIAAYFSNQDTLAEGIQKASEKVLDPAWRLPLYMPYRDYLCSNIADLNNNPIDGYGGAISAALFLKEFVPDTIPWLHFDIMAWNTRARPGHPIGGEAMGLRAIYDYLKQTFTS